MIAELRGTGTESYDMVTWKTSDPVTGTVVSYTNDGTSNTGIVSNQTEPLGQSISLSPPPVEPEPPTYEAHLFDAYDPEWQCNIDASFYGGFNGLPDHCQNKILKNLGLALKDIFGWHPSSVSKIVDSPLPGYVGGGSDGMAYAMGRALSSSNKLSLSGGTKTVDCPDTDSADGTIRVCTSINGLRDKNRSGPSLPNDIDQRLDAGNSPAADFGTNGGGRGEDMRPCTFQFFFAVNRNSTPSTDYTNSEVLLAAQREITQILATAGHRAVFGNSNEPVDGSYSITIQGGTNGTALATGIFGSGFGSLWTGRFTAMAKSLDGSADNTSVGRGVAIGRVVAHEAVTHNFLMYENGFGKPFQHTKDGLTRPNFGSSVFSIKESGQYQIPAAQNGELWRLCGAGRQIPGNYV